MSLEESFTTDPNVRIAVLYDNEEVRFTCRRKSVRQSKAEVNVVLFRVRSVRKVLKVRVPSGQNWFCDAFRLIVVSNFFMVAHFTRNLIYSFLFICLNLSACDSSVTLFYNKI